MLEWEERNNIKLKEKWKKSRQKNTKRAKKSIANKENQNLNQNNIDETRKSKEERIQKLAEAKVETWIERGLKESWLSFKNN